MILSLFAGRRSLGRVLLASGLVGSVLGAQAVSQPTLSGRVVRPDSVPIVGATVRVMQGATVHVVRSDDAGRYRIAPMADGSWTVAVQAVGHVAHFERLAFAGPTMERDFTLKIVQTQLDAVLIEGDWSGVRGFVADDRDLSLLSGARITVLSKGQEEQLTDTSGRFSIERPLGSRVLLRVQRLGYADRIVPADASNLRASRLVIRLDTLWEPRRDAMLLSERGRRLQWAGAMTVQVGREEIAERQTKNLDHALWESPTMVARGIYVSRSTCLFIDGVPMPDMPYDAVDARTVDFVEAYGANSDFTKTLETRWPMGAGCGQPPPWSEPKRGGRAQFIVIWTRQRKPTSPPGKETSR